MRRTGLMVYIYPIGKFYIGRHKSSKKSHEIPIRHRLFHKTTQDVKSSTLKKEILIKKTLNTATSAKMNIKSVQVI